MNFKEENIKVALVQAAPVLFNLEKSIDKAIILIKRCVNQGAKLIMFPELFVPCYPKGLDFGLRVGTSSPEGRADWMRLNNNSMQANDKFSNKLAALAKELNVFISIGVSERDSVSQSLYNANFFYNDLGELSVHRKVKELNLDKGIWCNGTGADILVQDTNFGNMSVLIGVESYMPLLRANLYQQGVGIYLAPNNDSETTWQDTIKHIAVEGRCFVLACNQFITKSMYPISLEGYEQLAKYPEVINNGGSAIVDPYGNYLVGPIYGKEALLLADLSLVDIISSRFDFNPVINSTEI